jgi:hypothetical protein
MEVDLAPHETPDKDDAAASAEDQGQSCRPDGNDSGMGDSSESKIEENQKDNGQIENPDNAVDDERAQTPTEMSEETTMKSEVATGELSGNVNGISVKIENDGSDAMGIDSSHMSGLVTNIENSVDDTAERQDEEIRQSESASTSATFIEGADSVKIKTENSTEQLQTEPEVKPETLPTGSGAADQLQTDSNVKTEAATAQPAVASGVEPSSGTDMSSGNETIPMDKEDKDSLQAESSLTAQAAPEASIAQYSLRAKEADARIRKNKCVCLFIKTIKSLPCLIRAVRL